LERCCQRSDGNQYAGIKKIEEKGSARIREETEGLFLKVKVEISNRCGERKYM